MFPPGIIYLLLLCGIVSFFYQEIELIQCIFPVKKLCALGGGSDRNSGWYMDNPNPGFYFVYVLTALSSGMETFEPDIRIRT